MNSREDFEKWQKKNNREIAILAVLAFLCIVGIGYCLYIIAMN